MRGFLIRGLLVKGCVLLLCVAGLAAGASSFPGNEGAKVDGYVRGEMQRERIPGLALGGAGPSRVNRPSPCGETVTRREFPPTW